MKKKKVNGESVEGGFREVGGGGDGGGGLKWTKGGSRKGSPRGSLSPTFNFRQSKELVTSPPCLISRRGPWEEDARDQLRTSSRALNGRFSRIYGPSSRFPFDLIAAIELRENHCLSCTVLQEIGIPVSRNRAKIEPLFQRFETVSFEKR